MKPLVSVVIPARNECAYIEGCVRSVLRQEVEGGLEVIVADGASTDGTADAARAAGARVIANPEETIPAGLNAALAVAQGSIVIRFDAHAHMPDGYVAACVSALNEEEPGTVNVGGWRQVEGQGPWGRAVAAALASHVGVGNRRIWRKPPPGARRERVDTVPLGCWQTHVLEAAGGWDESFPCNEDFELNRRLRRDGGEVVFDPAIWSVYYPRESLRGLASQYWRYGTCKALMLNRDPLSVRPRQLAPLGLATALAAAPSGSRIGRAARAMLTAYVGTLGVVAWRSNAGWRLMPVLGTMHLTWTAGLLLGLVRPRHQDGDADER